MKVLFVCVLACLAVSALGQTDEQKAKVKALMDVCVKSSGVDVDLILKARKKEFVENDKLKEYIHCMFTKLGFLKDGVMQKDVVLSKVPVEKQTAASAAIDKCIVKEASPQETAYKSWKCFLESMPELLQF